MATVQANDDRCVPASELVGQREIAELFHVKKNAVWLWQASRTNGFPDPVVDHLEKRVLWDQREVIEWYLGRNARPKAKKLGGYLDETVRKQYGQIQE